MTTFYDDSDIPSVPPRLHVVLVAEDEVIIRMVLAEYLRGCGLQVIEAADGAEAIKVLGEPETQVDLVFSDVQMPDVDGFELAHWVRANRPGVPVILTTGSDLMAQKARDLCLAGPVLPKPYEHEQLMQRLRKVLSASAAPAAACQASSSSRG